MMKLEAPVAPAGAVAALRERLRLDDGIDEGMAAALMVEAVVEELGAKCALFARLERETSDAAVLATNTSSLAVTAIAAACRRPGRVLGVHFFNPAPVLPLRRHSCRRKASRQIGHSRAGGAGGGALRRKGAIGWPIG